MAPADDLGGFEVARTLSELPNEELADLLKTVHRMVDTKYRPLLQVIAQTPVPQTPEQLAESLGWTVKDVREKLGRLVAVQPQLFAATAEFMPDVDTIVGLIEDQLGSVTGANLSDANRVCTGIVDTIVRPRYRSFIRRELSPFIDPATDRLSMSLDELVTFLLHEYKVFVRAQDQGLTSKAGGLNEAIFARALRNAGLSEGTDFEVTGTKSSGDLAIYCDTVKPRATLYAEIKSWGARERLLRGLQDVQTPKIGIGFFTQAKEFNRERTNQFLATQALAIYMPQTTYDALDATARARLNARAGAFYRPLPTFVIDVRRFTQIGENAYSS